MTTKLVTATLSVALPVWLTGHARKGCGKKRPASEGLGWRRGQVRNGDHSTRARRRSSRYIGGVPVGRGTRGKQEGENQHERDRGRDGSRRRLLLRHAGFEHVIDGTQVVAGERGREGGAPPQVVPVLERARGEPGGPNDLVRAGRGGGARRRARRARNTRGVVEGARGATRPPGDASPAAIHRVAQHTKRGGLTRAHLLRCFARPPWPHRVRKRVAPPLNPQ